LGKKRGRCSTRYCGAACQAQHWKEGGHDKLCKKIKKAGGAEQYYANKKHAEAVKVAVERCAEDTKGQKCYICLEAVHSRTGEGLVRGCACGDRDGVSSPELGVAHVSCLARQAKISVEEAEENHLDMDPRWARWYSCSLCKRDYHGVVQHALGWACWKTYSGRPEGDHTRTNTMRQLGNGLGAAERHKDRLGVHEAELAIYKRSGASEKIMLQTKDNIALCYSRLGRIQESLALRREIYANAVALDSPSILFHAANLCCSLRDMNCYTEAKPFLREHLLAARRTLGADDEDYIRICWSYASCLMKPMAPPATTCAKP